jgi:hypothetical protein
MSATAAKPDRQGSAVKPWNAWAEFEDRLNEISTGGDPADHSARAVRFEWSSPNSPKHD